MSLNSILATAPLTTTNFLLKATGTTIGNSLIFDNGTNVGIGNTNTSYTLDVSGTLRNTGNAIFASSGGNVGIGTASPSSYAGYTTLTIDGTSGGEIDFKQSGTLKGDIFASSTGFFIESITAIPLILSTNATERMRITSGGNVLIGTSTDNATKFQVNGAMHTNQGLYLEGTDAFIWQLANSNLRFATNSTERMRITSGGNVGIGTNNPPKLLTIYTAGTTIMRFQSGAATTDHWDAEANQTARFYISNVSTGNGAYLVYNSASGWTGVSDARWKTDWTSIDGSLDLINRLNIGKYKMLNNDKEEIENARWDYGIKAQELLDIIPDAVDVPKDENDKYGVIHNIVFYNAIKAIQELSKQNEELSNRLIKLESK
jgi:hypothetical protein